MEAFIQLRVCVGLVMHKGVSGQILLRVLCISSFNIILLILLTHLNLKATLTNVMLICKLESTE